MSLVNWNSIKTPKKEEPTARTGDWLETFQGDRFYPLDPRPDEVHLKDIAHALSLKTRFNGQSAIFYSVAEHAVRCAVYALATTQSRQFALATLHHDSAEAYLPDVPAPIKPALTNFKEIENGIQAAIYTKFNIPTLGPDPTHQLKSIDLILLATEARDLMTPGALKRWNLPHPPLEESIIPWTPQEAEQRFTLWHNLLEDPDGPCFAALNTLQTYGVVPNYS